MNTYTEDALVEQPAIALFQELGWQYLNCFHERFGDPSDPSRSTLGRETPHEVVLVRRLRDALKRFNPDLPAEAIEAAIEQIIRDRSVLGPAHANRELYALIKDGVKVTVRDEHDAHAQQSARTVRVIDWDRPGANDYFLASQFWVSGDVYKRRADLVGFVNGLPLVFIELKASHKSVKDAYSNNLRDYKRAIPQLFTPNTLIILSNGSYSRIGSMTADWDHFDEWKRINSEGEEGVISLDTMIRGTCDPARLLDLVENFTLFSDAGGGLSKIVARNHQYLGVNSAIEAVRDLESNRGRLGVFWHTQGSGKSYSMLFLSQKILRKLPGNWTFLVVTDRQELDDQIYKTFSASGAVVEKEGQVHAYSGSHLQRLLREDHRYVFTLIHKFHAAKGETYPTLSDRSDIIVITDEAHRSQYDTLALNMRNALPNAAFLAFTGTPLISNEERTRDLFGDYISVYNFKQSIDDGSTVPLYYENRIPELQLTNADLNTDMEDLIEEADLDGGQQEKLEREFARQYHLITRDDRLDTIAEDIVQHFMGRGYMGKAMVVCIDKATAIKMYDKVGSSWRRYLSGLEARLSTASREEQGSLQERIAYMQETGMAVVISQSQNEVEDLREKGLDITPHRKRMLSEDLDTKFKDADDPFRIVFVCAMWMTGFDAPSVSTIYLDKPMRNHTLMQTIARANRVHGDKLNGLIVDYVGVFRDLQKALAIYGSARGGEAKEGESPVKDKSQLVEELREALSNMDGFCRERGSDPEAILVAYGFVKVKLMDAFKEAILLNDTTRARYIALFAAIGRLYKAILPDPTANEFAPLVALYTNITAKIVTQQDPPDISKIMEDVEALLDLSIEPKSYVIRERGFSEDESDRIDLGKVDLASLRGRFEAGQKYAATQDLRAAISQRLERMVQLNKTRTDYLERFQQLIDDYNSGANPIEEIHARLRAFHEELDVEERRNIAEGLTGEELALYDLLTKPSVKLTQREKTEVKQAAHDLLETLKREKLVLDWRKRQQSRAQVMSTIETILDRELPQVYTPDLYQQKCEQVYQHVYDSYFGAGQSVYAA